MVGQHDAARTHANLLRGARDMADQHGRGRTRNAGHIVVLGQPVAFKAQFFCLPGRAHGDLQGVGHGAAFAHGDQVEHGQLDGVQGFHNSLSAS